jgi:acetyl esterase/lipase
MNQKILNSIFLLILIVVLINPIIGSAQIQNKIKIEKDIVFGESVNFKGENETLLLDIYYPAEGVTKNRPVILWMHGGGFRIGNDKSQKYIVAMSERFAKRGYVCLSINYRVRENPKDDKPGTMKDALEDAMKGLNWLRENSEKLGVNKSKIVIGGGSAGGILGTNFCYREGTDSEKWDKSGIIGFVNLWGSPDGSWGKLTIDKNDPPTIIVHGTEDASVPFKNSVEIIKKLNSAGVKNELFAIEGAGHTPASHMDDFEKNIAIFLDDLIIEDYTFKPLQKLRRQHGLQDPFLMPNGKRVSTKKEWQKQRQYIKTMLAHYQYGEMPPVPQNVVVKETLSEEVYNGTAIKKEYVLTLKRNGKSLDLHFGLIKPKRSGSFPVVIKNDRSINEIPDEINLEAIKRGYIMCQYVRTDLSLDDKNVQLTRSSGIFPLYPEYDWGTIAVWAWGYQLIIDYFETLDFVDIEKIVVTGHSRGGKTAFCGGIYDERIAITAPNSSGLGGTASHRYFELGQDEQTIGHASFANAHWWTPEFFKLAGFEARLPYDAHFGKAIIAPRAFFNAHALQDYWANPFGTFLTFEAAKKVYKWMGVEDNIKMHWRTGGHLQGVIDWLALLDFSDQYFYNKKVESRLDINPYPTVKVPVFWDVPDK